MIQEIFYLKNSQKVLTPMFTLEIPHGKSAL